MAILLSNTGKKHFDHYTKFYRTWISMQFWKLLECMYACMYVFMVEICNMILNFIQEIKRRPNSENNIGKEKKY